MVQTVRSKILSRIYGKGRGWVFSKDDFLDLGNPESVWKSLRAFNDGGKIRRLSRGLYDYPKEHASLGLLAPRPEDIAEALVRQAGARIQPAGAYAANLLGLSEQVPARVVFLTDGGDRTATVGKLQVRLKHTGSKQMYTAGRVSGLVIQALKYIGKSHVDSRVLRRLGRRVSAEDRKQLIKDVRYAPAWIGEIFRKLAAEDMQANSSEGEFE